MSKWAIRIGCWVLLWGVGVGVCSCGKGPVAIINGQKISAREFYGFAGKGPGGANALTGVILERMVLQAAQKAGITASEKEIDERTEETRERLKEEPGAPSLEELVRGQFITWEDYRWQTRLSVLLEKLCTREVKETEEDIKKFFEENRGKLYDKPDCVDLHAVALRSEKEAQEVRGRLVRGERFEELVREQSLEFQAEAGNLGKVSRKSGVIPEAVFDAVWKLSVGEITQPLKEGEKYYLARLDEKFPAEKADYEKVKEQVRQDFRRDNGESPQLFLLKLRDDAKVEILWEQFGELEKQFKPSLAPLGMPAPPAGKGEGIKPGGTEGKALPEKGKAPG